MITNADLITHARQELAYTVDDWDDPVKMVGELTAALEAAEAELATIRSSTYRRAKATK